MSTINQMTSEKFRQKLIEMVKASGQEVIDRAEDLVGNGDLMTDFEIILRFPIDGRMFNFAPTIEVIREHIVKNSEDVFADWYSE